MVCFEFSGNVEGMQTFSLCFIFLLLLQTHTARAHQPQEGQILVSLGPTFYSTEPIDEAPQNDRKDRLGAMLLVEGDVDRNGGIEVSLGFQDKLYYKYKGGFFLAEEIKRLAIGAGYRHWFNPWFSVASHFVSLYSIGDAITVHTDYPL